MSRSADILKAVIKKRGLKPVTVEEWQRIVPPKLAFNPPRPQDKK